MSKSKTFFQNIYFFGKKVPQQFWIGVNPPSRIPPFVRNRRNLMTKKQLAKMNLKFRTKTYHNMILERILLKNNNKSSIFSSTAPIAAAAAVATAITSVAASIHFEEIMSRLVLDRGHYKIIIGAE